MTKSTADDYGARTRNDNFYNVESDEVARKLQTDPINGLSEQEAKKRLAQNGPNALTEKKQSNFMRFIRQFNNSITYILILAAIATFVLKEYSDSIVIGMVVIINALIGYFQEVKASSAIEKIKEMLQVEATVIRDGKRTDIPAEDLVDGDVVFLEAGDNVPADLRIIDADNLKIQESMLTGEADSVLKDVEILPDKTTLGDQTNMAFASTAVTNGSGLGVVVKTGTHTELGQISASVDEVKTKTTPLMREINGLGKYISYGIIVVALLLGIFGFMTKIYSVDLLVIAIITMIVGSLPEGLPASTSVVLAMGVKRMTKEHAIVKSLPAVETLGAVDVINTDKTGTLTKNEMTVEEIVTKEGTFQISGTGYDPTGDLTQHGKKVDIAKFDTLHKLILAGNEANDTTLEQEDGKWVINGEPTDGAFLTLFKKVFPDGSCEEEIDKIPFDSDYRYMAELSQNQDGKRTIWVKGSPDKLFEMAAAGDSSFDQAYWNKQVSKFAKQGRRVVALAYRSVDQNVETVEHQDLTDGLVFLGIAGLIDPPREETIVALREMQEAGIKVKMITGDHPETASAIAEKLGLDDKISAITGAEIDEMDDKQLKEVIQNYNVFARTTPANKLRIVEAYQANGLVTAMTGDGVNDAPALKRADIGVAMGIKGTDVAKESADMVLADDNFATLTKAIKEGRRVYDNIKKTIRFLLPTSFAEGLIVLLSIMAQQDLPLVPTQLLWINMVSAITIQFAFLFEPAEEGIMQRPPRPSNRAFLSKSDVWQIVYVSVLIAGLGLVGYDWLIDQGVTTIIASTVTVNVIVFGKIFYLFNIRTPKPAFSKDILRNLHAFWIIGLLLILQLALTYAPFMQGIFSTGNMTLMQWGLPILAGLIVLIVTETDKFFHPNHFRQVRTE
ncbi:cation-transporting P-type ATPase [Pediococcus argentinicus]|uniref:Cation transport ATPase n=1 Tax=Pediococcus argentinicus TaxID=480391 RepID=A0A0R2NKS7_9LACO|nr:cation-transporting P-type ATPase [Pediococcus argentinicus]KRO25932.1 cation transport ATPase [Pediococcus argentinicus]NKZ21817.1 cation-transporting P-type ATPase [Pediococcus argentinicus]GEP18923.1 cation-transporting ATPase [Pediococcus argentinicus]